ncbi:MAG: zf-HC2 domain-containing protein [Deltaproteobacteria bacterium]|nr:zf-HC2 domain-containing protein [Deltaproteobacteria bacterium]
MDHQRANELFSEYLEGELPPEEKQAVEEHLAGCDTCRAELEAFRTTLRGLSGLHTLPPPTDFAHQVEQRIHRRSRGRFFGDDRTLSRIPFEWLSFALIVFVLAMYVLLMLDSKKVATPPKGGSGPAARSGDGGKATPPAP